MNRFLHIWVMYLLLCIDAWNDVDVVHLYAC